MSAVEVVRKIIQALKLRRVPENEFNAVEKQNTYLPPSLPLELRAATDAAFVQQCAGQGLQFVFVRL